MRYVIVDTKTGQYLNENTLKHKPQLLNLADAECIVGSKPYIDGYPIKHLGKPQLLIRQVTSVLKRDGSYMNKYEVKQQHE